MKNLILVLLFCFPISLLAQQHHELKIDAIGLITKRFEISYERIFTKNFGLEIGFRRVVENQLLDTFNITVNPAPPFSGSLLFKKRSLHIRVQGNLYLNPNPSGNNGVLGMYLIYLSKNKFEDAYLEAYELYRSKSPFNRQGLILGVSGGYKLLFAKEKITIEPNFGTGLELIGSFYGGGFVADLYPSFNIKVGYRF